MVLKIFFCSFLVTFLPETANHRLPDTIQEGELMGKGDNFYVYLKEKLIGGKKMENRSDGAIQTTTIWHFYQSLNLFWHEIQFYNMLENEKKQYIFYRERV